VLAVKIPAKSDAVAENEPRIKLENDTFLRTIVLKRPVVKNDDIIIDSRILLRLVSVFEINDKCKIIKTRQSSTSVSFVLPLVSHFEYTLHRTLCAKVASSTKRGAHNVSHRRRRSFGRRQHAGKFGEVWTRSSWNMRPNRYKNRHAHHNTPLPRYCGQSNER